MVASIAGASAGVLAFGMMLWDPRMLLFMAPGIILGLWAQAKIAGAFARYSRVPTSSGYTGAEAARAILRGAGLAVGVEPIGGDLTDHYDPRSQTLRLSARVYGSTSVAAVGIAAHEAGHALQHAAGYAPMAVACGRLGVGETAFHKMRTGALAAALADLEPKPLGRRPRIADEKDRRIAELEAEIDRLRKVVAASQVREELALAMPFLAERRKLREEMDEGRGGKKGGSRSSQSADGRARTAGGPGEPQGAQARREDEDRDGGQDDAR